MSLDQALARFTRHLPRFRGWLDPFARVRALPEAHSPVHDTLFARHASSL